MHLSDGVLLSSEKVRNGVGMSQKMLGHLKLTPS